MKTKPKDVPLGWWYRVARLLDVRPEDLEEKFPEVVELLGKVDGLVRKIRPYWGLSDPELIAALVVIGIGMSADEKGPSGG